MKMTVHSEMTFVMNLLHIHINKSKLFLPDGIFFIDS